MVSFPAARSISKAFVPACLSLLCALCLFVAVRTAAWPLIGDASLIHYVVFLLDSGWKPYAQIGDINLPGAYLIDWLAMHLLGGGAIAERLYDYTLSVVSMWVGWRIAPPRVRPAGIFAAAMFFLLHARDGAEQTGQRDWTMTVLVLLALVAWLHANRAGGERFRALAGCLIGCAGAVKPLAFLFLLPLVLEQMMNAGLRRAMAAARSCGWLLCGSLLPAAACALWLAREGALRAFLSPGLDRMRFHAPLHRLPAAALMAHGISGLRLPLLLAVALFPVAWNRLRGPEFRLLCGATAVGALCYLVQGKGYPYHRYAFAFLALETVGAVLIGCLSSERRWARRLAAGAFGLCCLWLGPQAALHAFRLRPDQDQFGTMLRADLQGLGGASPNGASLDGKIQCLDTFSGCIRVLYELRLHPSTGVLYDEFLFGPSGNAAIEQERRSFAMELARRPPTVLVMTAQDYSGASDSYEKVDAWPWFAEYLAKDYRLCVERTPKMAQLWQGSPRVPLGYRIYLRRNLPGGCAPLIP